MWNLSTVESRLSTCANVWVRVENMLCELYLLKKTTLYFRHKANTTFIKNILNGKIDSPTLLSKINFKSPSCFTRRLIPSYMAHVINVSFLL